MEKNGFIRRESVKKDARLKQIIPTKKAEALREKILEDIFQREKKMTKGIEEEDLKLCRKVLEQIAETMNTAAKTEICQEYDCLNPTQRFIPFIAVHEFETLLFSDTKALADGLGVAQTTIDADISRFSTPEHINNSPLTAPSKRLERWYPQYGKTTTGIAIAKTIPVDTMRAKCPLFNQWLSAIEAVAGV